jgi:type VI secretion system protein ImpA
MQPPLDYANEFFATTYGITCTALLAPIDAAQPQGEPLRGTPVWQAIRRGREADDAALPLGPWVRQLKRAAWGEVALASADAIALRSKDLQLAIWMAEALLHEYGFTGLAAAIALIDALCQRYWDVLYPAIANGDLEHRANLFLWLNEKLIAPARLVPLTQTGNGGQDASTALSGNPSAQAAATREYDWADCEQLRRQLQVSQPGNSSGSPSDAADGIDAKGLAQAFAGTSSETLALTRTALRQGIAGLKKLGTTLDVCFDGDAPGLGMLRGLLEQIHAYLSSQLAQRGVTLSDDAPDDSALTDPRSQITLSKPDDRLITVQDSQADEPAALPTTGYPVTEQAPRHEPALHSSAAATPQDIRQRVYAQLTEAAETLSQIEPHSPVPCLIRKAVEWGSLNTAQLYDELFIQGRGQLNVFELLGLGLPQAHEDAP